MTSWASWDNGPFVSLQFISNAPLAFIITLAFTLLDVRLSGKQISDPLISIWKHLRSWLFGVACGLIAVTLFYVSVKLPEINILRAIAINQEDATLKAIVIGFMTVVILRSRLSDTPAKDGLGFDKAYVALRQMVINHRRAKSVAIIANLISRYTELFSNDPRFAERLITYTLIALTASNLADKEQHKKAVGNLGSKQAKVGFPGGIERNDVHRVLIEFALKATGDIGAVERYLRSCAESLQTAPSARPRIRWWHSTNW